jgi:hypothetical protein
VEHTPVPQLTAYFRWLISAIIYGLFIFAIVFFVERDAITDCLRLGILATILLLATTGPSEYSEGLLFAPLRMLLIGILIFITVAWMTFFRMGDAW